MLSLNRLLNNNFAVNKQEEKLETILAEVLIDIDSGNYEAAAIKANTLYWDSSWSNEEKAKWNSTRKAIIKQIEEAKEKENSSSEEVGGWFNWFD